MNFGNSAFESRPSASVSEAFQTSDAGGPFTSLPGSFTGEPYYIYIDRVAADDGGRFRLERQTPTHQSLFPLAAS